MSVLFIIFAIVAGVSILAALFQGIVAFQGFIRNTRNYRAKWLICAVFGLLAIIFGFATYAASMPQATTIPTPSPGSTIPHPTVTVSPPPTESTSPTQPTSTDGATAQPTSTGISAKDGKYPVSIRLTCTSCSDPILVTITSIDIQSQLNRMQWTITLENTGPDDESVVLSPFYLLEGDQTGITNPIPPSQGLEAKGGATENEVDLSKSGPSTAHATTILTFAFVPSAMPYTLESSVHYCSVASGCGTAPFEPKLITFIFK
jgi:hypothetical protein